MILSLYSFPLSVFDAQGLVAGTLILAVFSSHQIYHQKIYYPCGIFVTFHLINPSAILFRSDMTEKCLPARGGIICLHVNVLTGQLYIESTKYVYPHAVD
jgi:hypothetical protein